MPSGRRLATNRHGGGPAYPFGMLRKQGIYTLPGIAPRQPEFEAIVAEVKKRIGGESRVDVAGPGSCSGRESERAWPPGLWDTTQSERPGGGTENVQRPRFCDSRRSRLFGFSAPVMKYVRRGSPRVNHITTAEGLEVLRFAAVNLAVYFSRTGI